MKILFVVLSVCISLAIGIFLMRAPDRAIEMQKKFYARINWRMEPISMPRELHNTRLMGWVLVVASFMSVVYLLMYRALLF